MNSKRTLRFNRVKQNRTVIQSMKAALREASKKEFVNPMSLTYDSQLKAWHDGTVVVESAPLLDSSRGIPMAVAEEAYKEYVARHGNIQSLERINQRGGFGAAELAILLYDRIKVYQRVLAQLQAKPNTQRHTCGIDGDPGAVAPLDGKCKACEGKL